MRMKGLIYYFTILSALTAGNAFAECTLNPDYNFPITATIRVSDITMYTPGSAVGVQIMRGNEVITPGQELSLGEGSTAGIDYEFGSRAFRINDKLTEGSLNVPVVFSMAYQ